MHGSSLVLSSCHLTPSQQSFADYLRLFSLNNACSVTMSWPAMWGSGNVGRLHWMGSCIWMVTLGLWSDISLRESWCGEGWAQVGTMWAQRKQSNWWLQRVASVVWLQLKFNFVRVLKRLQSLTETYNRGVILLRGPTALNSGRAESDCSRIESIQCSIFGCGLSYCRHVRRV